MCWAQLHPRYHSRLSEMYLCITQQLLEAGIVLLSSVPFYSWGNQCSEKWSDFPRVLQLVSSGSAIQTQVCLISDSMLSLYDAKLLREITCNIPRKWSCYPGFREGKTGTNSSKYAWMVQGSWRRVWFRFWELEFSNRPAILHGYWTDTHDSHSVKAQSWCFLLMTALAWHLTEYHPSLAW